MRIVIVIVDFFKRKFYFSIGRCLVGCGVWQREVRGAGNDKKKAAQGPPGKSNRGLRGRFSRADIPHVITGHAFRAVEIH